MSDIITLIFIRIPRKLFRILLYRVEHLYYLLIYSRPKLETVFRTESYLLFGGDPADNTVRTYHRLYPEKIADKIKEASLICDHTFTLLGSGPKKLSSDGVDYQCIDWHSDFKSGHRWDPKTFYRYIRYGDIKGVDIIVPWEQSRFQDRMALAQAFILSGDTKYIDEFQKQVIDWIDNNRFGFGVNWFCTMDIAIRAANWLVIKDFLDAGYDFPKEFLIKLYGSIYDHGRYIRKHLQRLDDVTTNHYVSGIVGLLCIAVYCPFYRESKEWSDYAIQELEKEIDRQVYDDGCDYEASTSYHILVLEIFFYAMVIGERAGISFSNAYKAKVKKMFEASLHFTKLNGQVPQIGDNDNGRIFKFSSRPVIEHRYLLSLAAIYFNDSNFKLRHFDLDEEAFWVFGENAKKVWDGLPYREDEIRSKSFPDAGWHIIRHNKDYCFISCGPTGQGGRGGHAHNDKLSFELMIDGKDIIVDPGTYAYTSYPEERNKFRSTGYHNTLIVNGREQNEFCDNSLFLLRDSAKIVRAELKETDGEIVFHGVIQYADILHERIITADKNIGDWQIKDSFTSQEQVNAKLMFHLSPGVTFDGNNLIALDNANKIASIAVDGHQLIQEDYEYSSEYGVKVKALCLSVSISAAQKTSSIITSIRKH